MRLCTFEVATHVGRHRRLGAWKDNRIVDLNFATAWYMAQQGEPEPQRLADGLVPADLLVFLRAGLRATHSAEELFLGAGPHPADWWISDPPPRGPNDETLVYRPGEVRLRAPLEEWIGPEEPLPRPGECRAKMAAVIGRQREDILRAPDPRQHIAGFTILNETAGHTAMGPLVLTIDKLLDPYNLEVAVRVNGAEVYRGTSAEVGCRFDEAVKAGMAPAHLVPCDLPWHGHLRAGERVEIEVEKIGVLRNWVEEQEGSG